jgi:hypothetical protein
MCSSEVWNSGIKGSQAMYTAVQEPDLDAHHKVMQLQPAMIIGHW